MASESEKIIYSMIGVGKSFDKKVVLKDIYLSYFYGAKIGVLGLNGSGKSTLLRILAGEEKIFDGQISLSPGFSLGFLAQEPKLTPGKTVRQIVEEGLAETFALLKEYEQINEKFAEPMDNAAMQKLLDRQGHVQEELDKRGAWEVDRQLDMAMDALRLPPGAAAVDQLSGGEQRCVALCRLLLRKPDVLILDEPTNHLDAESVAWLEQHLQRYAGTVIAVTHDRYFLDNVAGWILELDRGQGIPWKGNYSSWLEQKKARLAIEEKSESKRQRALAHELEWVRKSPQARRAKNKARLASYEQLYNQDVKKREAEIEIYIPPGPRLGEKVIDAAGIAKGYNGRLLFENLTFSLPAGGVVGVVGPNGSGKTTLFRLITGAEKPDGGSIDVGASVKLAYVEQGRDDLEADQTVWEAISEGKETLTLGSLTSNSRAYVARFGFSGTDQQKKVSALSGGERNRVHLARMLKSGANVLLLDEPTNDLDVNIIRALEDAVENFAGCAVVVSHDRWFLDRVATHILAFEGDSNVVWFDGNYSDYEIDRHKRLGSAADQPHRIKYRKLTKG